MNITILERKPGVFRLRIEQRVDGVRQFKTLTVKGTVRDAEAKKLELLLAEEAPPPTGGNLLLYDWGKEVFERRIKLGEIAVRTGEGYLASLEYVRNTLGKMPLDKVTKDDVQREYVRLYTGGGKDGAPLGVASVRAIHSALRFLYRLALDDNRVGRSPVQKIKQPKLPAQQRVKAIPAEKVVAFLKACDKAALGPLMRFAISTGARRGEIVALKWEDVDFDQKTVSIRRSVTESKRDGEVEKAPKSASGNRTIALPKKIIEELKYLYDHRVCDYVFDNQNGGRRSLSGLSSSTRRLMLKHGLSGSSLHDLRHTHATQLLNKKHNIKAVSQRLGHADVNITLAIYAHVIPQDDRALADEIERVTNGEAAGKGAGGKR